MSTERELVEAVKFKGDAFNDRQDYLAALVRKIDRMPKSWTGFDDLSDTAADWYNNAVTALNSKKDIADFEDDDDAPVELQELEGDDDPNENAEITDGDMPSEAVEAAEHEDSPIPVVEDEVVEEQPEPKPKKVAKGKALKPLPGPKKGERLIPEDNSPMVKDRFGCFTGTKTHEAVKMYEKGCTGGEIYKALGGRYYNILKDLAERGHRVEKLEGGVFKLTHSKDIAKAVKEALKKK